MVFHKLTRKQRHKLKGLHTRGVPPVALQLVALCFLAGLVAANDIALVEFFAGQQAVTNAFVTRNLFAVAFEYETDPTCEDILSRSGFAYALALILSEGPGSAVWFFIARETSTQFKCSCSIPATSISLYSIMQ